MMQEYLLEDVLNDFDLVDLIWSSLMNSFILIDDISSFQVCLSDIMFLHNSAYFLSIFAIFIFGRQYSQFSILETLLPRVEAGRSISRSAAR